MVLWRGWWRWWYYCDDGDGDGEPEVVLWDGAGVTVCTGRVLYNDEYCMEWCRGDGDSVLGWC